eukprot:1311592-Amphidinium_carterae.1
MSQQPSTSFDWAGCPVSRKSTTGVICQLWSSSIVHYSRTQGTIAQSSAEAELDALTSAANDLIHLQSVIIEMGIAKSTKGIKLHVHTDSASGKAMVSQLGMSKKSKHIELKYLHLQDIPTKFMPQSTLSKHFGKVGLAETSNDEVSIQHLKAKLKISAISSSTAEMDVRTP